MSFSYNNPAQPIVDVTIADIGDPWTEVRRNLATDPSFEKGTSPIASSGADQATLAVSTVWAKSGAQSLRVTSTATGNASRLRLSAYNLSTFRAGKTYTVLATLHLEAPLTPSTGWMRRMSAEFANAAFNVRTAESPNVAGTYEHRLTFTVPATGVTWATVLLHNGSNTAGESVWWDDLMIVEGVYDGPYIDGSTDPDGDRKRTRWLGAPDASASVEEVRAQGDTLRASGGTVTLDENYSPYVSASISVPLTADDLGERIDPRQDQRVTVTVDDESDEFAPPRVFDLGIRDRTVDHGQRTLTIEAASDEARLHDTCRLATTSDRSARAYEASLRGVVNWALGKIGASLEPGGPDLDMTASWDQTNLAPNPRAFVNTDGWSALVRGGAGNVARGTTSVAPEGAPAVSDVFVNVTSATTSDASARFDPTAALPIRITEGRLYTLSAYVFQNSGATRQTRMWLGFKDDTGRTTKSNVATAVPIPHSSWTKVTVTAVAPVNTSQAAFEIGVSGAMAAGTGVGVTCVVLAEGVENDRWFDGDRPDEARYVYDYTPVAGTPSTRVALNPRDPEMFSWDPGESLFDFLRPFLESSGLRLYCDEARKWWLVEPAVTNWNELVEAIATGASGYSGIGNAIAGTDVISRDRADWATGVVVAYTWRTANGDRKTKYDVAGTADKVITIERETAYPGPGAAAVILAAVSQRGRTQSATITRGYEATPGFASRVSLPGTDTQDGRVRRVVIEIATGNAQISTNGTETP